MKKSFVKPGNLEFSNHYFVKNLILKLITAASFLSLLLCLFFNYKSSKVPVILNNEHIPSSTSFSFTSSKNWKEWDGYAYGAQYDCTFLNSNKISLENWVCEIQLSPDSKLDSCWSGNFVFEKGKLVITPLEYNYDVPKDEPVTFGFILHSNEIISNPEWKIVCYRKFDVSKLFWFNVSLMIFIVCIIFFITTYITNKRYQNLLMSLDQLFDTIVNVVDTFDEYTYHHSRNVAYYSMKIAQLMKLKQQEIVYIYYVALVHDIGKISIMRNMLNKSEKFTDEERELMKQHTTAGAEILKDFTMIPQIQSGALYHHERFDGKGYPHGLKGEEIPLFARIICVADCFDAMTTQRSYWQPISVEDVCEEIKKCSGTQFDPQIVPYMIKLIDSGLAPIKND